MASLATIWKSSSQSTSQNQISIFQCCTSPRPFFYVLPLPRALPTQILRLHLLRHSPEHFIRFTVESLKSAAIIPSSFPLGTIPHQRDQAMMTTIVRIAQRGDGEISTNGAINYFRLMRLLTFYSVVEGSIREHSRSLKLSCLSHSIRSISE